ncbi:MAG TPA: hypothetical protein VK789_22785 [Bryobacteraceae bacterium]|nr:hypothetical protein [Bryobacteraceae bacterium]
MAKLINILAASVGGGFMLGAGIRLGEALAGRGSPQPRDYAADGTLAARIGLIEGRLTHLEGERRTATVEEIPVIQPSVDKHTAELEAKLEALGETSLRLRTELQSWIESSVTTRMADLESRLKAESERTQKQMLDALVDGVQTRVMHRIGRLEEELASQSAAMTELRECSIRTEQSMQKLLGGLDRLIVAQHPAPADPEKGNQQDNGSHETIVKSNSVDNDSGAKGAEEVQPPVESQPDAESQPSADVQPRSRRWAIFG